MKKYLKRFKRKIKYNRKANNIFLFLFVMFLFMGVGYAYLNATLSITGTGKVTKTTWDVHFENIQPITGSVTPTSAPVISDDTTVSFSATLNEPGDFYSFYIDLVNAGTIDASIDTIDITPVLTTEQQEYFEYKIKYKGDNSLDVQEGDALSHGDTKTIEILFRYKELDNDDLYPDEDVTFNFMVTVNAIQGSYDKEGSVLRASSVSDKRAYKADTYRENIKTITLDDHIHPPTNYIESWDVSEGNNGNVMAYIVSNNDDNTKYDLYIQGNGHLYAPENSSYLFASFYGAEKINNVSVLDTSNVTTMERMLDSFGYNSSSPINLDLANWNTSNVVSMNYLFMNMGYFSSPYVSLDLSNWDTSKVTNMNSLFAQIGGNNTSSVGLSINISNWDTSNVITMHYMFRICGQYSTTWNVIGLSNLDTSKVTDMSGMFDSVAKKATNLDLDLSLWDTSNVTTMENMFKGLGYSANTLRLDLSGWNTSKVENMDLMFLYAGLNSNSVTVIIPRTNGNGLNNTTTSFYGKTESVYTVLSGSRVFTLAST